MSRKMSAYSRKRKTKDELIAANPVAEAVVLAEIMESVRSIKTKAELQALMGGASGPLIEESGQLLYAVAYACKVSKVQDCPDIRILRGTGEALANLNARPKSLEQHRESIISGLSAIERLIPEVHPFSLGLGLIACREKLRGDGFGADDIHALLTPAATIGKPVAA